jgi:hypothetical protein
VHGFKPNGTNLNPGTRVFLTSSLGTIQPEDSNVTGGISLVEIDGQGQARARLVGDGRAGDATVTASLTGSGGSDGSGGSQAQVTVRIGAAEEDKPTLVINANPTVVPVLGTSQISLLGRNSDNTPVSSGQRIRLTVDLGDLTCDDYPDGGCGEVFTDANGEAEATFVAGTRGGTGNVAAILGTSDEVSVEITIRDAVASLFLSADRQTVQRVDTGTSVSLTALLQDAQGEPVSGTVVVFETERGSLSDNAVPSNAQGEATSTLTVTADDLRDIPENGSFSVTATATSEGSTASDSLAITVLGAP